MTTSQDVFAEAGGIGNTESEELIPVEDGLFVPRQEAELANLFTDDERAMLIQAEDDKLGLRNTNERELQALRRRGMILYTTRHGEYDENGEEVRPGIGHGKYLKWIEWRNLVYNRTEGREGFDYSVPACENYMNLYWLDVAKPDVYRAHKHLGATKLYLIAKWVKQGNAVEDLLDKWRNKQQFLGSGEATIDPEYPGLISLVDEGKLNEREAERLVQSIQGGLNTRIAEVVRRFGVRDCEALGALIDIENSYHRRRSEKRPTYDLLGDILINGHVTLSDGTTQAPVGHCSHNDIWLGYSAHIAVLETSALSSDNSGGGSSIEKLINRPISRDEALRLAQTMNDSNAQAEIASDSPEIVYKLVLSKTVEE